MILYRNKRGFSSENLAYSPDIFQRARTHRTHRRLQLPRSSYSFQIQRGFSNQSKGGSVPQTHFSYGFELPTGIRTKNRSNLGNSFGVLDDAVKY